MSPTLLQLLQRDPVKCIPLIGPSGSGKRHMLSAAIEQYNRQKDQLLVLTVFDVQNLRSEQDVQRVRRLLQTRNVDGSRNVVLIHRLDHFDRGMTKTIFELVMQKDSRKRKTTETSTIPASCNLCITFDIQRYNKYLFILHKTLPHVLVPAPNFLQRRNAFKTAWIHYETEPGVSTREMLQTEVIENVVNKCKTYHEVRNEARLIHDGLVRDVSTIGKLHYSHMAPISLPTVLRGLINGTRFNRDRRLRCGICDTEYTNQTTLVCTHGPTSIYRSSKRLRELEHICSEVDTVQLLEGLTANVSMFPPHSDLSDISSMLDATSLIHSLGAKLPAQYIPACLLDGLPYTTSQSHRSSYNAPNSAVLYHQTRAATKLLAEFGPDYRMMNTWQAREMYMWRTYINPGEPDTITTSSIPNPITRTRLAEQVHCCLRPMRFDPPIRCRDGFDMLP
jgi:hypothetical protein